MENTKVHFRDITKENYTSCNVNGSFDSNVNEVNCGNCKRTAAFKKAEKEQQSMFNNWKNILDKLMEENNHIAIDPLETPQSLQSKIAIKGNTITWGLQNPKPDSYSKEQIDKVMKDSEVTYNVKPSIFKVYDLTTPEALYVCKSWFLIFGLLWFFWNMYIYIW